MVVTGGVRWLACVLLAVSFLFPPFASGSEMSEKEKNYIMDKCKTTQQNRTEKLKKTGLPFCPAHSDSIACWGPLPAGMYQVWACPLRLLPHTSQVSITYAQSLRKEPVPSYLPRAVRACNANGNWSSAESDLSRCYLLKNFKSWRLILHFGVFGFSLLSLFVALAIFFRNKKLLTLRNQIHCHLFLALCIRIIAEFLFTAFRMTLFKKTSPPVCYSLMSLMHFSALSTMVWLLMEGFYLVLVTKWLFGLESLRLWNFGLAAWGLPVYLTIIWIFLERVRGSSRCDFKGAHKARLEDHFIEGPLIFLLVIDFGICCFCIRKLYNERRYGHLTVENSSMEMDDVVVNDQESSRNRAKNSKAHLLLDDELESDNKDKRDLHKVKIPIVQRKAMIAYLVITFYYIIYMVLMYVRVPLWLKEPWILGVIIYSSLQGFIAALMLCFLNFDVRMAYAESYRNWRNRRKQLTARLTPESSPHSSKYSLHD